MKDEPLIVIAGPCAIEPNDSWKKVSDELCRLKHKHPIKMIFKGSYSKANRTRLSSYSGLGLEKCRQTYDYIKMIKGLDVTSDVHTVGELVRISRHLDIIQIPVQMCKNTKLLLAAAKYNLSISIKKGRGDSVEDIIGAIEKIRSVNKDIMIYIIDRGMHFGYDNMVVDMRFATWMLTGLVDHDYKCKNIRIILDVSHSIMGDRCSNYDIYTLAQAGIAAGYDGIFVETFPHPFDALCDSRSSFPLNCLDPLIKKLIKIKEAVE